MTKRGVRTPTIGEGAINWRTTDAGVELYDESNPDAWIHVDFEAGVPPERRLLTVCPECGSVSASRSKPGSATVCGACTSVFEHAER